MGPGWNRGAGLVLPAFASGRPDWALRSRRGSGHRATGLDGRGANRPAAGLHRGDVGGAAPDSTFP